MSTIKYCDCTRVCLFISIVRVLHKLGVSLILYCLAALNDLITAYRLHQRLIVTELISYPIDLICCIIFNHSYNCLAPESSVPTCHFTRFLSVLPTNCLSFRYSPLTSSLSLQPELLPSPSTHLLLSKQVPMSRIQSYVTSLSIISELGLALKLFTS
jgi:hypothetical protein